MKPTSRLVLKISLALFGIFAVGTAIASAGSSYADDAIYEPVERAPTRVLATVTGGWARKQYRSDANMFYADRVLRNYVRACDAGYDVDVILVSYTGFDNWTEYFHPLDEYHCHRTGGPISVRMEFFEWRPIPSHTFGIGGDLITRHREIFARERDAYDIFVSQEDDVSVGPDQLDYFSDWSTKFEGTEYYPGFLNMEILEGVKYLDWRIKNADVFEFRGDLLSTTGHLHTDGRSYMLTKRELALFSGDEKFWTGSVNDTHGEFQPNFATPRWMHRFRKIVHPVRDFERSIVHHMSNKYVKLPVDDGNKLFVPLTLAEQHAVFARCTVGIDCRKCVEETGAARLSVVKESAGAPVVASFECIGAERVKFSGFSPDSKKAFRPTSFLFKLSRRMLSA